MRKLLDFALLALLCAVPLLGQSTVVTNPRITGTDAQTFTAGTGTAQATVEGTLTTSTTQVCTIANTTETDLWTYVLPANTLNADGKGIRITVWGTTAANANIKSFRLYFGATQLQARNASADNNWVDQLFADVVRTGAATQSAFASSHVGVSGGTSAASLNLITAPTETLSGPVTIRATGINGTASAGDVCVRYAVVETIK